MVLRTPRILVSCLLVSCGGASPPPATATPPSSEESEAPAPEAPSAEKTEEAADPGTHAEASTDAEAAATPDEIPATSNASALFEECRTRVEGREKDGECQSDDDCSRAGCSSEVCVTTSLAAEVMTTCEVLPCFAVLDTCGCVEGRCSWSLVADGAATMGVPEGGNALPQSLPADGPQ